MSTNDDKPPIQWPTSNGNSSHNSDATNIARARVEQAYNSHLTSRRADNRPPHGSSAHQHNQADNLEQYHAAWQNYYQEYFRRYYNRAYSEAKKQETLSQSQIVTSIPASTKQKDKVTSEIRQKIRDKASKRARKIQASHHFKPILTALAVGIIFLFMNYNQVVFGAVKQYLSPSTSSNTPVIVTPGASDKVGPEPKITIPRIGVVAPVIYDENSYEDAKVNAALEKGTLHYGTTALPGQDGNIVIMGHSSNNAFVAGDYKYVFVNLDRLQKDDIIYLNYKGQRYTYKITVANKVIEPTDLSVIAPSDKPILTLITCTPAGTNLRRLVVRAVQIDPSPSNNSKSSQDKSSTPQSLPATSKGIVGRFF